ncbi:outer membrane beta-barrel protein [Pseudoduganella sp. FT25W]|uniref:Outer membrane beta-barrel protein n=2 Tax=Duganella alba TaxID=2666081 RepID=A0A6L5QAB4_9BURK|nr:outer membrane beta-barrel protein [Duganella alba]MRX18454.1 outer membrane beta-barrel protein [Duganella alba]
MVSNFVEDGMKTLVAGLIALGVMGCASAADDQPWYVGADAGLGGNYRQDGGNGRVYVGYQLGTAQLFGMEFVNAAEAQLYKLNFRADVGRGGYTVRREVRVDGSALAWAPTLKVSDRVAVAGRVGVAYNHANVREQGSEYASTYTKVAPLASLGASYALSDNVRLRADVGYTQVKIGSKENVDHAMLSTGVSVGF